MLELSPITASILAAIIALCLGLLIVPLAKKWGRRFGLVDAPDQKRKLHSSSIPLIGGIAVFVTVLLTLAIVSLIGEQAAFLSFVGDKKLIGLFLASLLILAIGVIDDRFAIRGRQKLLGQFAAATVLIYFGYRFDIVSVFGLHFNEQMPAVYILVAYAWILIGINSVNLLDGADGFATTIGIVTSVALCVMALGLAFAVSLDATDPTELAQQKSTQASHFRDAIICAAMASALIAFLKFNFPPATAFLGDAGSMLIGLFIAAMAIKSGVKQATSYAFLAPIALLAIPMFDTLAAILRRKLTGRSIYDTDRGHLHHALMGKGFGPRKSLLLFFAMCLMTATGGTMALIYQQAEYAALAILSVAVFLFVGRIFGMAEFELVSHRSKSAFRSLLVKPKKSQHSAEHSSIRLQGDRDWDLCWQVLREFAEKHHVSQMTFDLNLPWIHESFHAQYKTTDKKKSELEERWQLELPLTANQRSIGRLNVQACINQTHFGSLSMELAEVLASLEDYIVETMESHLKVADVEEFIAEQQSIEFGDTPAVPRNIDIR